MGVRLSSRSSLSYCPGVRRPAGRTVVHKDDVTMRTITVEEHFATPSFNAGPGKQFNERLLSTGPRFARIHEQLQDIGAKRAAEMDAAKIDMQVLSLKIGRASCRERG